MELVNCLPALPGQWECDLADDRLHWSPGVYDLFGIARGRAVSRAETAAMYMPESREILEKLRREAIATCGSFTFEAQIMRRDGGLRWMRLTADVVIENGRVTRLYGHKRDITDELSLAA